jgi:hypothetical protein
VPKVEQLKIKPAVKQPPPPPPQQQQQIPPIKTSNSTQQSSSASAATTINRTSRGGNVLDLDDEMFAQIDIDAVVRSSKPPPSTTLSSTTSTTCNNYTSVADDDAAREADVLDDALLALDFDALRAQTGGARKSIVERPRADATVVAKLSSSTFPPLGRPTHMNENTMNNSNHAAAVVANADDDRWANEIDLDEIVQSHNNNKQRAVLTNAQTNTTSISTRTFGNSTSGDSSFSRCDEASLAAMSLDELQSRRSDISAEVAQLRAAIATIDCVINQRRQQATNATTAAANEMQPPSDFDADSSESNARAFHSNVRFFFFRSLFYRT